MDIAGLLASFSHTRPKGNNVNDNTNWKPQAKPTFKALHDLAMFPNLSYNNNTLVRIFFLLDTLFNILFSGFSRLF